MKVFADFQGAFYKKPLEARFGTQFQHVLTNKKSTAAPCFFLRVLSVGASPQTPTQRTFHEKSFGNQKAFAGISWYSRREVLWLTFLSRKVREGDPLTAVPTCFEKLKKHGNAVLFCAYYQSGLSAPNPDTKDFS